MSEWRDVEIGELCEFVVDCVNRTAPTVAMETPYKMIRTTNVRTGWIDTVAVKYVDEPTYRKWTRRAVPRRNDVILTREAPLGEVGLVRTDEPVFLGQRLMHFRVDREKSDHNFLLYALMGDAVQAQLKAFGSGATVEHVRVPDCLRLIVRAPGVEAQRRIGSILGALDDLIENNRRRIALLERIVRAIYREWFVHFRYPGHEDDELVDSPIGPIPSGWDVLPVSDVVEINPTVKALKGSEVPFVTMGDLTPELMHVEPSTTRAFGAGGSRFQRHDTLFARITPSVEHGKTGFVQFLKDGDVGMGSTEFVVLRSRRLSAYSTYLVARRDGLRLHAIGSMFGASGRQRVNNACFDTFALAVPPAPLEQRFANRVAPAFESVEVLSDMSGRLGRLRDLLLPRLVTGAIDVSKLDLDARLEEPAA